MVRPKWLPSPSAIGPPCLAAAVALCLYVQTAPPSLTWAHDGADGGDLIAAAMTRGVPHPTGYPTYCLLGRLFALLPLGSPARRFALFSATAAAATIGLLCLTAQRLLERNAGLRSWWAAGPALVAAFAVAVSPIFWSQAIIAEVYALNALFFALGLYLVLHAPARAASAWIAGLALGLGLGNHLTLSLALPGLTILAWARVQREARPLAAPLIGGLILGLVVYAYLPLAARRDPPVNWGDPRTCERLLWVVTGRLYRPYVWGVPLASVPARLVAWAGLWVTQLTWPGVILALVGLAAWLEGHRRSAVAGTLALVAVYSAYAVGYDTADSFVYLIPAYLTAALWMAQGTAVVTQAIERWQAPRFRWAAGIVPAILVLLFALSAVRRMPSLCLRDDREATAWIDDVTARLPTNALVITLQDRHTFALAYARWVEGRRADITVVDADLLTQSWYLDQLRRDPALALPPGLPTVADLVAANLPRRPVFLASTRDDLAVHLDVAPEGVLWRVTGLQ